MKTLLLLSSFAKTDEAMCMYQSHCDGLKIADDLMNSTLLQSAFLNLMSAKRVGFLRGLDTKVKALCEANGVKFKK